MPYDIRKDFIDPANQVIQEHNQNNSTKMTKKLFTWPHPFPPTHWLPLPDYNPKMFSIPLDPEIKACTGCVHCHGHDDMMLECRKYPIEGVNYVHGTKWNDYILCHFLRQPGRECGPEGKGYEPRPAPAEPETPFSFRRWLGLA